MTEDILDQLKQSIRDREKSKNKKSPRKSKLGQVLRFFRARQQQRIAGFLRLVEIKQPSPPYLKDEGQEAEIKLQRVEEIEFHV